MNDDPASTSASPHRLATPVDEPSRIGCAALGCFGLLLLAATFHLILLPSAVQSAPASCLPAYTALYMEVSNRHALRDSIAALSFWDAPGSQDVKDLVNEHGRARLSQWAGELPEQADAWLAESRGMAFALVPLGQNELASVLFLDMKTAAAAVAASEKRASPNYLSPTEDEKEASISAREPAAYVFTRDRFLILTRSGSLRDFIESAEYAEATLADAVGHARPVSHDLLYCWSHPHELRKRRRTLWDKLPHPLKKKESTLSTVANPEARVVLRVMRRKPGQLLVGIETLASIDEHRGSSSGASTSASEQSSLVFILLLFLAAIFGPVALLLLLVLGLALYFYLTQWLSGNLTPLEPTRAGVMPEAMREDLERNPTTFTRSSSGTTMIHEPSVDEEKAIQAAGGAVCASDDEDNDSNGTNEETP